MLFDPVRQPCGEDAHACPVGVWWGVRMGGVGGVGTGSDGVSGVWCVFTVLAFGRVCHFPCGVCVCGCVKLFRSICV